MRSHNMTEEEFSNEFNFKICVIGDGAVGKTSLIKKFTQGSFNKDYIKTVGAQFSRYEIKVGENNKIRAQLFFWDIAGQQEFTFMRPSFYKGAKATIIVYDLTREDTMRNVTKWIDNISTYCGKLPTVCFGNKSDLIDEDNFDGKEIKKIAKDCGFLEFHLTSAKTGKHIQDSFNSIINILVKNALKEK